MYIFYIWPKRYSYLNEHGVCDLVLIQLDKSVSMTRKFMCDEYITP